MLKKISIAVVALAMLVGVSAPAQAATVKSTQATQLATKKHSKKKPAKKHKKLAHKKHTTKKTTTSTGGAKH